MPLHADNAFAPIDGDLHLERIAGGNETEVYVTDDRRFVVKVKDELGGTLAQVRALAHETRDGTDQFIVCLGERFTIPSSYLVARDSQGHVQLLVLQPFLSDAQALHDLDYTHLSPRERHELALQLREIIRRALLFYQRTGSMPDLYGRRSASANERRKNRAITKIPQRIWAFLARRTLLRANNLMRAPDGRVALIDYDVVRRGWFYRLVYFAARRVIFLRDLFLIAWMERGWIVPAGEP